MSANIVIPDYSSYGTTHELARSVQDGASDVPGTSGRLRRIPELPSADEAMSERPADQDAQEAMSDIPRVTHNDLRWADGIIWGTPTRFGTADPRLARPLR